MQYHFLLLFSLLPCNLSSDPSSDPITHLCEGANCNEKEETEQQDSFIRDGSTGLLTIDHTVLNTTEDDTVKAILPKPPRPRNRVYKLVENNFKNFLKDFKRVAVKFFNNRNGTDDKVWERDSKYWSIIANATTIEFPRTRVYFASINVQDYPKIAEEYGVKQVPTIKYFLNEKVVPVSTGYRNRTNKAFAELFWLLEEPPMKKISEADIPKYQRFTNTSRFSFNVIAHLKKGSVRLKTYHDLAKSFRTEMIKNTEMEKRKNRFRFLWVPLDDDKDPKKYTRLQISSRPRNETINFDTKRKFTYRLIFQWIMKESVGIVSKYTVAHNNVKYLQTNGFVGGLFVGLYDKEENKEVVIAGMKKLARIYPDLRCTYDQKDEFLKAREEHNWWPLTEGAVFQPGDGRKFAKSGLKDWESFVKEAMQGKVKPFWKTAVSDVTHDDGIRIILGSNYEKLAYDTKTDLLVLFYVEDECSLCHHNLRELRKIQKLLERKNIKNIIIGKFDGKENDASDHRLVEAYPKMFLYPATDDPRKRRSNYTDTEITAEKIYEYLYKNTATMKNKKREELFNEDMTVALEEISKEVNAKYPFAHELPKETTSTSHEEL